MNDDRSTLSTFDTKAALKAVKSREGMIAFAGFSLQIEGAPSVDGLMKISEVRHAYRGEALVLTFVIDGDTRQAVRDELQHRFQSITKTMLESAFGNNLERFTNSCLACVDQAEHWLVFEFQIVFRVSMGQKKTLVEQDLVPLLEQRLPCRFQPVEWWPQAGVLPVNPSTEQVGLIQTWIKKWFG